VVERRIQEVRILMGRFDSADRDEEAAARLRSWTRVIVREGLSVCGLSEVEPIPLVKYVEARCRPACRQAHDLRPALCFFRSETTENLKIIQCATIRSIHRYPRTTRTRRATGRLHPL
jgi:hypothetical protein